ncbi:MAG: preprotein translocase subunit SecG [Planctomycetes bacterium]|nr:preprotein translocase subunit SecG [Planctomycetota bacterium]
MEPNVARIVRWVVGCAIALGVVVLLYYFELRALLTSVLMLTCVLLVTAILMQSSKGGGLAALGGLGDQSPFGARSAGPLRNVTYVLAGLFAAIIILLGRLHSVAPTAAASRSAQPRMPAQQAPAPAKSPLKPAEKPAEKAPAPASEAPKTP